MCVWKVGGAQMGKFISEDLQFFKAVSKLWHRPFGRKVGIILWWLGVLPTALAEEVLETTGLLSADLCPYISEVSTKQSLSQLVYRVFPDSLHSHRVSDTFQKVLLLGSSIIPWIRSLSSFWGFIFWPTCIQKHKSLPTLCTGFKSAFIRSFFSVNSVVNRPAENWKVTEHKGKEANYKWPGGSKVHVCLKGYGATAAMSQG